MIAHEKSPALYKERSLLTLRKLLRFLDKQHS